MTANHPKRPAPRGKHRILFVSDPSTFASTILPDPVQETDLRSWVDSLAASGVDTFNQEVFSQGWTVYWQSPQYEYDQRPQHQRFLPLLKAGTQPLDILIDQAHQHHMRFIAGFRINDGHAAHNRKQGVGIAQFIAANPQLRLHDPRPGQSFQEPEALDFTFAAVRDFMFGAIAEVTCNFNIDGIELCFRDTAYFPPDQAAARAHLLTDLVRRIRLLLNERNKERDKKLLLGARVYASLEECSILGLDVSSWIQQGLLDYISPQDVMYADHNLPYPEWSALTQDTACMLYPGLHPWTSYRARFRLGRTPLSPATARALAHTMYAAGADGLSIYNHIGAYAWHPPFYPHSMQLFHQLRNPERIKHGERHYIFDPTYAGLNVFGGDGRCTTGLIKAQQLQLDRNQTAAKGTFCLQLFEDLDTVYHAMLLFRGFGLTAQDELAICFNGHMIPPKSISRTASYDQAPTLVSTREQDGRNVPYKAQGGRIDFRATAEHPTPAFSTRWFALSAALVTQGNNYLSITLEKNDATAQSSTIVIDEVEVYVEPH